MAPPLRYTLVFDGTSDRALLLVIDWVLRASPALAGRSLEQHWTDPATFGIERGLSARIDATIRLVQPDVLFVHRDAEASDRQTTSHRQEEIRHGMVGHAVPYVPIIPVRMMEAWLLFDESALRRAAGNPNGTVRLDLPRLRDLESCPDPKTVLDRLLERASESSGRRLHRFQRDLAWCRGRVAELIDDFSPLNRLPAFQRFVEATNEVVEQLAQLTEGE